MLSPAVDNLVAQLTRLPGIGTRTAQRLTFHLLSVSPEEALADAPLILYDAQYGAHDPMRRQLVDRAQRAGVTLRPVIEVEGIEAAVGLARRGLGDTIVPRAAISRQGIRGLHFASFAEPLYDTFAFIARTDAPLSPAARAFVEIVERRLERVAEAALYAAGTSETD